MTKHKHYEMIVAKAANMELELFFRDSCNSWRPCTMSYLVGNDSGDYFLCLPQHKEACLHWLNGGDAQILHSPRHDWMTLESYEVDPKWYNNSDFMSDECKIRIKPKKEKRWIGYCANTNQTFPHPQVSMDVAEDYAARNYGYKMEAWQFIEIEVEVQS